MQSISIDWMLFSTSRYPPFISLSRSLFLYLYKCSPSSYSRYSLLRKAHPLLFADLSSACGFFLIQLINLICLIVIQVLCRSAPLACLFHSRRPLLSWNITFCECQLDPSGYFTGFWRWWKSVHHQGDHNSHGKLHLPRRRIWSAFPDTHLASEWYVKHILKYTKPYTHTHSPVQKQ